MVKKIVISSFNNIAAIIQNNKIQELIIISNTYQVNDIYIGIVHKIFTSINAAFIRLNNTKKNGFIHLTDIKSNYKIKSLNLYNISRYITLKQKLLVQIIKEPTHNKGPKLTNNIHLSGRYLILMPFNNTICLSHKIYDENERSFLRSLGILIKPDNMGILFKESCNGIKDSIIIEDLRSLKKQWYFLQKSSINSTCPSILYEENDIISKVLKDFLRKDTNTIIAESNQDIKKLYESISINKNSQIQRPNLNLYKSNLCVLEQFNINESIFQILNTKVELQYGIHMFIESSEALTIIDVNSGGFNSTNDMQNSLLHINCLAASEIAYQLQVRNINGIIIIDFIDMKTHKDQIKLLEHFSKVLKNDHAKPEIIQLSELGLVELTRRRRGQSLQEIFENSNHNLPLNKIYDKVNMTIHYKYKTANVNNIFFKKQFKKNLTISTDVAFNSRINLLAFKYRYIIPLNLYYTSLECINRS
uniref:Ribonuclease E n=1 Tax=Dichotomaria marginata TaxID=268567 RepID=A0A1G4NS22_9FLOR|nr:Ribonuclease E [Dichotomaria marginata]SCW21458.1 Ribonuclease E [Dichotomaria marginata]